MVVNGFRAARYWLVNSWVVFGSYPGRISRTSVIPVPDGSPGFLMELEKLSCRNGFPTGSTTSAVVVLVEASYETFCMDAGHDQISACPWKLRWYVPLISGWDALGSGPFQGWF